MAVIGIDLGTTNSLVACWAQDHAVVIPNVLGEHLTPSIVSVDENGEIVVGRIAQERLITHPKKAANQGSCNIEVIWLCKKSRCRLLSVTGQRLFICHHFGFQEAVLRLRSVRLPAF
ncbi:hypothetical protein FHS19_003940 [Paenibacillus rhizosphaerae]|uniref:Chaperone protein DnaK n=1 Tax=Paenibacillus rhizosphaerae TaxID=297318 RepID=A0A839TR84_9BACL|nr:hypothetical protein [Paenibacillus rhizosphaerae]